MAIYLNSVAPNVQPGTVLEEIVPIQSDTEAIDGTKQRNRINTKYQATLTWPNMGVSDYQQVINIVSASGVVSYLNTLSDYNGGQLQFVGLATFKEAPYVPGASLYRPLTVVLRQT